MKGVAVALVRIVVEYCFTTGMSLYELRRR